MKSAVASIVERAVSDDNLKVLLDWRPYVTDIYGALLTKSLDELLDAVWNTVFHKENDALQ